MIKKALLLLGAAFVTATSTFGQGCITDLVNNRLRELHPEIAVYDAQLEKDIAANILKYKPNGLMRGTATDTVILDIPVVVHVVHDFGPEYLSDDKIYAMMDELNATYSKSNLSELAGVIQTFKPYIGNMYLRFHLATKNPSGNPTHGITRTRSYLTAGGDDQAKLDNWNPNNYLNIWFIKVIGKGSTAGGIVAAYSMYPGSAVFSPYYDGVISNYQFITGGNGSNTIPHEVGHYFNLQHTFGNTNNPGQGCGDDGVDDTPPTTGQFSSCNVYDVACASNYVRNGIDYPDTTNVQNIMNYSSCELMFTKGQAERTRAAARSSVAGRSNLFSSTNLFSTGALNQRPALPPTADFSNTRYFGCVNINSFTFTNRSWNDTLTSTAWTFSNGASTPTSNSNNSVASLSFSNPGWVTVSLTATGKNGTNNVTKQPVYVAEAASTNPGGYVGEFVPGADADKYPVFNYYNTPRNWGLTSNAGVYDQYSMKYTNNDNRTSTIARATGTPDGDYSDFFTPGFDVTAGEFGSVANLTFFTAGTYRAAAYQNDLLEITYSTDCGASFRKLDSLKGSELKSANVGFLTTDFTPSGVNDWKLQSIAIPAFGKTSKVFFRFRYRPGTNPNTTAGTGNNFYVDRIAISSNPTGINDYELKETGIALAPNPTQGNAFVVVSEANTGTATIRVMDVTGKLVYTKTENVFGNTKIEIPSAAISVKGIYLVQVLTSNKAYTRKLIVY